MSDIDALGWLSYRKTNGLGLSCVGVLNLNALQQRASSPTTRMSQCRGNSTDTHESTTQAREEIF